jgi:CheY-like chemotaxis protein
MKQPLRDILIVDDEADLLRLAQLCLQTLGGFQVTLAATGDEALQSARANRPDLVLLDVMMPVMDGPSTLAAFRADPRLKDVPVIFMTARVRSSEVDEYLAMGADGVVAKPYGAEDLLRQIGDVWDRFHASPVENAGDLELADLRQSFIRSLEPRMVRLRQLFPAAGGDWATPEARAEILAIAHKLAGSCASFGLENIGGAAMTLEDKLIDAKGESSAFFARDVEYLIRLCELAII